MLIVQLLIILPLWAISIYLIVLNIMLARRGITALDIYIEKNKKNKELD